jgi:CRP-like cAMP-binding protein
MKTASNLTVHKVALQHKLKVIHGSPLFADFSRHECLYLLHFFEPKPCIAGDLLIHEGQLLDEFYLLSSGRWQAFLPKDQDYLYRPKEVHLSILEQSGLLLGEYSFVDQRPASASIRALDDGEVYRISRRSFEKIVNSSNRVGMLIYRNLLSIIVARVRKQTEDIDWQHLAKEL